MRTEEESTESSRESNKTRNNHSSRTNNFAWQNRTSVSFIFASVRLNSGLVKVTTWENQARQHVCVCVCALPRDYINEPRPSACDIFSARVTNTFVRLSCLNPSLRARLFHPPFSSSVFPRSVSARHDQPITRATTSRPISKHSSRNGSVE